MRSLSLFDEKGGQKGDFDFASLMIRTRILKGEMLVQSPGSNNSSNNSSSSMGGASHPSLLAQELLTSENSLRYTQGGKGGGFVDHANIGAQDSPPDMGIDS